MTITTSASFTLPDHKHSATSSDGGSLDSTSTYSSSTTLLSDEMKRWSLLFGS